MSGDPPSNEEQGSAALATQIAEGITGIVPHNRHLGIRFVQLEGGDGVTLALPWREELVGNPETRVLHGGAITTLMDATCGLSVFVKMLQPIPVATLDLRIDYLRPARPEQEVFARARCVKVTRTVAFVRCEAYNPSDPADLVAVANGTFMVFRDRSFGRKGSRP